MGLNNPFKLAKLKISAFATAERREALPAVFEVMFNPTSFSMRYGNSFSDQQGVGTSGSSASYASRQPHSLSIDLVIDGSGVTDYGLTNPFGLTGRSVASRIDEFLRCCFHVVDSTHEPNFLRIEWGKGPIERFPCRLQSVDVSYTSFERDGSPLRAELRCVFVEDRDPRAGEVSSPDLTHTRVVKSGDTLPLLCKEIYGSPLHYLRVAQVNQLDDFRRLEPGRVLMFPPFERVAGSGASGEGST